jgi:formylglycine-generating enzyme required for sulfatase activity
MMSEEPVPVQDERPGLPPKLADLVMGLLAKKPEDRPGPARAVADALQAIERELGRAHVKKGLPVAGHISPARPLLRPGPATAALLKRRPPRKATDRPTLLLLGACAAALMLVLGLLGGVLLVRVSSGPAPATSSAKVSPAGTTEPEKHVVNSVRMKLVLVAAGGFTMGTSAEGLARFKKNNPGWYPLEKEGPAHQVRITRPFYLGAYEVTQEEYEAVMGSNPSYFAATGKGKAQVVGLDTRRFPVEMVSWHDATEFCRKLSESPAERKAGRAYRLPTEAEWEHACRAGTAGLFSFGNSLSARQANIATEKEARLNRTTTVGSYPPNAWGLFDMHGNVREWCRDGPRTYTTRAVDDPRGPEASGGQRVIRGGSWGLPEWFCRSSLRLERVPTQQTNHTGFRALCECQ